MSRSSPSRRSAASSAAHSRRRQAGLTLIELMVALVLGLLIAAAAVAALIIARTGFTSTDTSAQLRENARFATSLIQRIAVQAGFENAAGGGGGYVSAAGMKEPGVRGFDNSLVGDVSGWGPTAPPTLADDSRSGCLVTDTSCANGSDVLEIRYTGVTGIEGTMINCAGVAEPEAADRAYSIFHVARSTSGEPTLACTYRDATGWHTVPLVTGVEGFQVLYGVDTDNSDLRLVADRYFSARNVGAANWARVRSLRIGLVIRSSAPGAVDRVATTIAVPGAGFTDAADIGSNLLVPADGRLRQNIVFTVHLRNAQFAP